MEKNRKGPSKMPSLKSVTKQTFYNIEANIANLVISRFMVYKWIPPFHEMYIKL